MSLCKFAHFRGGFREEGEGTTGPGRTLLADDDRVSCALAEPHNVCPARHVYIRIYTIIYANNMYIHINIIYRGVESGRHTHALYIYIYIICTYRDAATRKRNAVHNVHSTSRLINYSRRVLLNYRMYIYMPLEYTAVVTVLFFDFFSLLLLLFPAGQRRVPDTRGRICIYTFNVYIGVYCVCI